MTSVNKSTTSNTNHSAAISRDEYSRIIWKLKCFENAIHLFHDKLIDLQKIDQSVLMTGAEVGVFDDVLHEAYEDLNLIISELEDESDSKAQEIARHLRWYSDHAGLVLDFLLPNFPNSVPAERQEPEYRCLGKNDLPGILTLIEAIVDGLPFYIDSLKKLVPEKSENRSKETDRKDSVSQVSNYESVLTARIKTIQPKFEALYNKYIFPDGSQLLTDPQKLKIETKALRKEVSELQNRMPIESEEWMDCKMAIDQLDLLIRLIDSKFEFIKSDLIALSMIVSQAGHDFSRALEWIAPGDGGDLVDTAH